MSCVRLLHAEYSTTDLIEILLAGATDHYFLSTGHVIDFTNKAFELFEEMTVNGMLPYGETNSHEVLATTLSSVVTTDGDGISS